MDAAISPPDDTDSMSEDMEFPVQIDTLVLDGVRPDVGDHVRVKVEGSVTRVVNDIAYVKPETVNDQPLPAPVLDPSDNVDEGTRLRRLSQQVGNVSDNDY